MDSESAERDRAAAWLQGLTVGQDLKVGKHTFVVDRTYGVTVFLTKGKSKGKKLYKLEVSSLSPFTVDVREVWGGSGQLKDLPPVARFQP